MIPRTWTMGVVIGLTGVILAQGAYIVHLHRQGAAWRARAEAILATREAFDQATGALTRAVAHIETRAEQLREERAALASEIERARTRAAEARVRATDTTATTEERLAEYERLVAELDAVVATQARVITTLQDEVAMEREMRQHVERQYALALDRVAHLERVVAAMPAVPAGSGGGGGGLWRALALLTGGVVIGLVTGGR